MGKAHLECKKRHTVLNEQSLKGQTYHLCRLDITPQGGTEAFKEIPAKISSWIVQEQRKIFVMAPYP